MLLESPARFMRNSTAVRRRFGLLAAAVLVAVGLVGGCSMTPSMTEPEAERELPGSFDPAEADTALPTAASDTARLESTRWWTAFGDTTLTTLIDTAVTANFDLQAARARVDELEAQFRIARAPLFPSVTANGQYNVQNQPANTGIGGAIGGGGGGGGGNGGGGGGGGGQQQAIPDRFEFETYQANLGVSYELDFWGRVRSQRKAALSQYFATAADLQAARISVISQTITTYFQAASLQRQVQLGKRTIDLLEQRLEITQDRYRRGLASSFQLFTVRQNLEAARSEQPDLESRLYDTRSRLATLLGRFAGEERRLLPDSLTASVDLSPVPAGLPSDLLMQRPDVRAGALRLEAARQQIGVARAEMLPSISLTGQGGVQSSALSSLIDIDQRFANFTAQLTAPLFQGGRLRANVDAAEARYRQQAARYQQTVLTAFQEVKAALVAYQKQKERFQFLQDQVEAARASFQTQRDRYERGIGDLLALLDAERALYQAQTRRAAARLAVVNARLALHRALGGTWTERPNAEDPRLFGSEGGKVED
jgi:multidrug efflux system outer membrane protein